MILYNAEDVKMPVFPKRKTSVWIKMIAEKHGKRVGDVAFIFCSDEKILEVNFAYLAHDYYTDIITFDYSKDQVINGDLFISTDTIATNAAKYEVTFENELYRVLIHGILHLCGIDDKSEKQRVRMRMLENEALEIWYSKTGDNKK